MIMDDEELLAKIMAMQNALEDGIQGLVSLNVAIQIPLTASLQYLWDMINA